MKISTAVFPALVEPRSVSQQPGSGLSFDDLLPRKDEDPSGPSSPAQQVFSFNALGILGAGGQPEAGSAVAQPVADDATVSPNGGAMPVAVARMLKDGTPHLPQVTANTASAAISQGVVAAAPVTAAEPTTASRPSAEQPHLPGLGMGHSAGFASPFLAMRFAGTSANVITQPLATLSGARIARGGPSLPTLEAPEPESRAQARESLAKFQVDAQPDSSSDVSVAVAEADGVLHIIAAAPDLPEEARQKVRGIADGLARDAGVALGGFVLNGDAMSQFHALLDRRSRWQ